MSYESIYLRVKDDYMFDKQKIVDDSGILVMNIPDKQKALDEAYSYLVSTGRATLPDEVIRFEQITLFDVESSLGK